MAVQRSAFNLAEKADYSFDFRGGITSFALLKITRVFREMKSNQTIEVLGLDSDTRSDLFKLLPEVSYEVIAVDERGTAPIRIHLKKT
jgi:TusA-related sulfurtransferase